MKSLLFSCLFLLMSFFTSAQTWQTLTKEFIALYTKGEYNEAVIVAEKARDAAKVEIGEDRLDYGSCLNNLALIYSQLGYYKKSEPLYIQVIEIYKRKAREYEPEYAQTVNNLAVLYYNMGQYDKAEPLLIQSMEMRRKILGENDPEYAETVNNLAALYKDMGRYEKAEPLYIMAKEIWRKVLGENDQDYAISLSNLALLYYEMGQYDKAEPLLIQARNIDIKALGENHPAYAKDLNNLASVYDAMGQYGKAEALYNSSKEVIKKAYGINHADYATALNNLASFYQSMGQYEKAEPLYVQVKKIDKAALGENHPDYAQSLNSLGVLYVSMHEYKKAEPLLTQALEIDKKILGEDHPNYASKLDNLGTLYSYMGQNGKAEPVLIKAMETKKRVLGESHPSYAHCLNNLAMLYEHLGQYDKAELLFIEALKIDKKILGENHPDYINILNNLALLYATMGKYEKAESLNELVANMQLQNLKTTFIILSEKEKGNYLANNISLIETNNSLLYNYRQATSALSIGNFNLQLIFKSLSLADTRTVMESVINSKDLSVQKSFKDWQGNKSILAKQYSLPINKRIPKLDSIEAKAEALEKELTRKSSGFRNQQKAISISMQDVQKGLAQGEAAIEFVKFKLYNKKWTDSVMYAAYVLRKNDLVPIFIPLCEEKQLQQLFDSAGKTSTSMVSKLYRGLEIKNNSTASLGRDLYKLVWEPLEQYLKGIKKIAYSPAGKLYSIAFHALPADSSTLLIDKYNLQQYTSTRQVALRTEENQITKPASITLIGNASFTIDSLQLTKQKNNKENISTTIYTPKKRSSDNGSWPDLAGTAEEVKKIDLLFNQNKLNTKTFTQTAASEENLKALNGNSPQILHIATHGFFLPEPDKKKKETGFNQGNTYTLAEDPLLRSGLILSGGNYAWSGKTPIEGVEDGIATGYEISQLNLSNTELVVLSACETALGDVKGSEGVFGLQRAFKMAGVKKLIVSLWQVPDKETAELMTAFYTYWMKGKTINESFTQAQADMRKKYSPFYWAAFVLVE